MQRWRRIGREDNFGFTAGMGFKLPVVLSEVGGDMTCCNIHGTLERPAADAEFLAQLIPYVGAEEPILVLPFASSCTRGCFIVSYAP